MKPSRKLPWRKLASDPSAEWQQLPLLTRGVAVELMRRLDPDDGLDCSHGVKPHDAICMVTGAHSRERRRVNEAIDELVRGRWLVLSGRRWLAFFPDLERARPSVEQASAMQRDVGGTATTLQRANPQNELTSRKDENHDRRGEEKREEKEESRGEEIGRSLARVLPIASRKAEQTDDDVVRDAALEALKREELASPDDIDQLRLGGWCRRQADIAKRELADVAEDLLAGFVANERARKQGYPLAFLQKNPLEYWTPRARSVGSFRATSPDVLAEMGER